MQALDDKGLGHFNPEVIKQFPLRNVEYIRDLGSGNFGMVFLGMSLGAVFVLIYSINLTRLPLKKNT